MNNPLFDPLLNSLRSNDTDDYNIIKYDIYLDKLRLVDKSNRIYYDYVLNVIRNGVTNHQINPPVIPGNELQFETTLEYISFEGDTEYLTF
jgi:hypothetical protein